MKRLIGSLIITILVLFLAVLGWLLLSQSGLVWSYQYAEPRIPGGLKIESLEGRLLGPIKVKQVKYQPDEFTTLSAQKVILDWNPVSLLLGTLDIQSLRVDGLFIHQTKAVESEIKKPLADLSLPLQLRLDDIQVNNLKFQQAQTSIALHSVKLSAATILDQLTLQQFSIKGPQYELNLSGQVKLSGTFAHKLQSQWLYTMPNAKVLKGQGSLTGDLSSTQLKQTLAGPLELSVQAQLRQLMENLNWQADIDLQRFNSVDFNPAWSKTQGQGTVYAQGNLEEATLSGNINGVADDFGPVNSKFTLTVTDSQRLMIKNLSFSSSKYKGQLDINGFAQLKELDLDSAYAELDMKWKDLLWPQQGKSWLSSPAGNAQVRGQLNDYQFNVDAVKPFTELPLSHVQMAGQGNLEGLKLEDFRIQTLQGNLTGTGKLDWSDNLQWQADINASNINPSNINPNELSAHWPGQLSGRIKHRGRYEKGQLSLVTDINNVSGQLRDYPLKLKASTAWSDGQLKIDNLDLSSGQSKIKLSGRSSDTLALQWTIESPDLGELYPELVGQLTAKGTLKGALDKPIIESTFKGDRLVWQQNSVEVVQGSAEIDTNQWQLATIKLDASGLQVKDVVIDSARFNKDSENISLAIISANNSGNLKLQGNFVEDQWQGQLLKADFITEDYANWSLLSPAAISFTRDALQTQQLCWANKRQAEVCSNVQFAEGQAKSSVILKQLPLTMLKPWLPEEVKATGLVNGKAEIILHQAQTLSGWISLELPEGRIEYPLYDNENEQWLYRNGKINIDLNQQGVKVQSRFDLNQDDIFSMDLELPGAQVLKLQQDQAIQAQARVNIKDLRVLSAWVPEVQGTQGNIQLKLEAAGRLNQLELQGLASLDNGAFTIPRLGLKIEQLKLLGKTDAQKQFNFDITARSGEGDLLVKGLTQVRGLRDWEADLTVTGQEFEVSNIPEARVKVTPNLKILIKPQDIDISGDVHIPWARLQPKDVSTAKQVSEDVVILGDEKTKEEKWKITTRIRLTLDSEHTQFFGFGFEGQIGGSLLLEDKPGQLTRATGEIKVPTGRYRAYGQRLDIENGRLVFSGGPITDPGLDFRAIRRVNEVTSGLKASGTLKNPQLDIFSIPAMGQTDALSYLVLGRPLESSSGEDGEIVAKAALALGLTGGDRIARSLGERFGFDELRVESQEGGDQASLVVGRYLSPKLYISYGVGLIESFNTFNVRYQINELWQLKAESGEAQGADLLFTIER